MMDPELDQVIRKDLFNELRWLLVAAASWQVAPEAQPANHFRVFCMDSAFVHCRNLFEFFTMDSKTHQWLAREKTSPASCHSFGAARHHSQLYEEWKETLEARIVHLRTDRD